MSQARQKLKASVFVDLNRRLLTRLEALRPPPRWRGLRLVAADSTTLRLPNWLENTEAFGLQWDSSGQFFVLARGLGLFAAASRLMLHATLAPFATSERALLVGLLQHLAPDDLLLLDRGFHAVWLFALFQQRGLPFLARIDQCGWPEVVAFLRSGEPERVIHRPVSGHSRGKARHAGAELSLTTVSFRLIRVVLPNGHLEVLATSLTDAATYPAAEFCALYHARWTIEEDFKVLKHRLRVEQFTGELPESIRQDFYAKLLLANLANALAESAHAHLPEPKAARYRPNLTYILNFLGSHLAAWLLLQCTPDLILKALTLFSKTLELLRPGRSAPRSASRVNPRPRRAYK